MTTAEISKVVSNIEEFDPFKKSLNALIVVAFPKSNSKNFPFALALAQTAEQYGFFSVQGQQMHVAAFGKNQAEAGKAVVVLRYISSWKGALIFSRGRMLFSSWDVMGVIDCYLSSCACNDFRAHCYKVVDDPTIPKVYDRSMSISFTITDRPKPKKNVLIDQYAFPCKYALPYFKYQLHHPSSLQEQVQAAGAQRSCDLCPHFDSSAFQKVGTRTEQHDAFE